MSTAAEPLTGTIEHLDFHAPRTCEHDEHHGNPKHGDGAEKWVRIHCNRCTLNAVTVRCGKWLTFIAQGTSIKCPACAHGSLRRDGSDLLTVIGPVTP